jgi:hypothetical protein
MDRGLLYAETALVDLPRPFDASVWFWLSQAELAEIYREKDDRGPCRACLSEVARGGEKSPDAKSANSSGTP